jgi:hypothetical protein
LIEIFLIDRDVDLIYFFYCVENGEFLRLHDKDVKIKELKFVEKNQVTSRAAQS